MRLRILPPIARAVLVVLGSAPAALAGWQAQIEPPTTAELPPAQAAARALSASLASAEADPAVVAVALKTLLDAGEAGVVRSVFESGDERGTLAVLRALAPQAPEALEPLVPALLGLASASANAEVRTLARGRLVEVVSARTSVFEALCARLSEPELREETADVIASVLGSSRRLAAVDVLLGLLERRPSSAPYAALSELTGHEPGAGASLATWRGFWDGHRNLPRDVLLELGRAAERRRWSERVDALTAELVQARIDLLGVDDVARLMAGLSDAHAAVRIEAARRLARHPSRDQTAGAVAVMLARLGHAAVPSNGKPGEGGASAPETAVDVRAEFVAALGVLGRGRDDVRAALLAELQSPEGSVSAAAVAALQLVRDQPAVVGPLLDYLEAHPDDETAVGVLQAVAANRPEGVLDRLRPWVGLGHPPRARAAAVRAIVASARIDLALEMVGEVRQADDAREVLFAIAAALGDRARSLAADAPERAALVDTLAGLLDEAEPSVRAEAAAALGRAGSTAALALLDQRVRVETEIDVVSRIVEALGQLRLVEAAPLIGRIVARRPESAGVLDPLARTALLAICESCEPAARLAVAEAVDAAGAHAIGAWLLSELLRSIEALPEQRELVEAVRALQPAVLLRAGRAGEARTILLSLHEQAAPRPALPERLALLAQACEADGRPGEAADWSLALWALLPPGEAARPSTRRAAVTQLMQAGRHAEALPHLQELLAADGSDNRLLYSLALVHEALGQPDQAAFQLQRLVDRLGAGDAVLREEVDLAMARVRAALNGTP